ncbi:MAG: hypothetical protein D8M57_20120 [Candidatus Scalindua sp. AMX11]|nr:hypothetical protein [Planctomycetota bacterium]NOG85249.1 hypothetical protein [Planctomycetota bacterium]NOG85915.1 hypothetical protein [Planctomycetota bacterium]RZV60375.1 MAG: hypothetical protein EX341_19285 [Candidatus Scalindua sp. SCAELEC01]TDE63093.1 MAG: hypothetical protein D8M57_20120 [Candidatus Scalindua sp. AMX11]
MTWVERGTGIEFYGYQTKNKWKPLHPQLKEQRCKAIIRWDSEPVKGLVAKPLDLIGKLFHR